jgi:small GTP-binding protein
MQFEENMVKGVVLAEFDQVLGPIPKDVYPQFAPKNALTLIASKSIDILYTEETLPTSTTWIDYPSLEKKGLTRLFQWEDHSLRGNHGLAAITVVFDEKDDVVFYRYRDDFEPLFADIIEKIIKIKRGNPSTRNFEPYLKEFFEKTRSTIQTLRQIELNREKEFEFPTEKTGIQQNLFSFKCIVVGDPEVGKTSTILRYTDRAFRRSYISTVGVNVSVKNVKKSESLIRLILWDLAGQMKFSAIRQQFYQGAHAIILVFDLTRPGTFDSISRWYMDLKNTIPEFDQVPLVLCGNKCDLTGQIRVPHTDASALAKQLNIPYFEISALSGKNNDELFDSIVNKLIKK